MEMESLNMLDLDVEALEQRLEMTTVAAMSYLCLGDCGVNSGDPGPVVNLPGGGG
jgi:hypothetical protein